MSIKNVLISIVTVIVTTLAFRFLEAPSVFIKVKVDEIRHDPDPRFAYAWVTDESGSTYIVQGNLPINAEFLMLKP